MIPPGLEGSGYAKKSKVRFVVNIALKIIFFHRKSFRGECGEFSYDLLFIAFNYPKICGF